MFFHIAISPIFFDYYIINRDKFLYLWDKYLNFNFCIKGYISFPLLIKKSRHSLRPHRPYIYRKRLLFYLWLLFIFHLIFLDSSKNWSSFYPILSSVPLPLTALKKISWYCLFIAVIINGSSDFSTELNKISLLKILWKTTLFLVCRIIMVYLISLSSLDATEKFTTFKGFFVLVFSLNDINLSYNIYRAIFLMPKIEQVFNLPKLINLITSKNKSEK